MSNRIGFIGYGRMGSLILNRILLQGLIPANDLFIFNRTPEKLSSVKKSHPQIQVMDDLKEIVAVDKLFLLVSTTQVFHVLQKIKPYLSPDCHLIYIAAGLRMENIMKVYKGPVSRFIPSITLGTDHSISLLCHNQHVSDEYAEWLENLLKEMGDVEVVEEEDINLLSDITSSGPAFLSYIIKSLVDVASQRTDLPGNYIQKLLLHTMQATNELILEVHSPNEVIGEVSTPGGITYQGLQILEDSLPDIVEELFNTTQDKYKSIETYLDKQYQTKN